MPPGSPRKGEEDTANMHESSRVEEDPTDSRREISGLMPVELIFQHGQHNTMSIFSVEFPIKSTVDILKQDMEPRLKVPPECQEWLYKGKLMKDSDSVSSLSIKRDEKILVKEVPVEGVKIKQQVSTEENKDSQARASLQLQ